MAKVCLYVTKDIREFAKNFPEETPLIIANILSLYMEDNDIQDMNFIPSVKEFEEYIKELRGSAEGQEYRTFDLGSHFKELTTEYNMRWISKVGAQLGIKTETKDDRYLVFSGDYAKPESYRLFHSLLYDTVFANSDLQRGGAQERLDAYLSWENIQKRDGKVENLKAFSKAIAYAKLTIRQDVDTRTLMAKQYAAMTKISPKTVKSLEEGMASWFSDFWTNSYNAFLADSQSKLMELMLVENPTPEQQEQIAELERNCDVTREEYLRVVTPNTIFSQIKTRFEEYKSAEQSNLKTRLINDFNLPASKVTNKYAEDIRKLATVALECFDLLCEETAPLVEQKELIFLKSTYGTISMLEEPEATVSEDPEGNFDDDDRQMENFKENWQYEYDTVSVYSKLPVQLRSLLSNCPFKNRRGGQSYTILRTVKTLPINTVIPVLLEGMHGIQTSKDVIPVLQSMYAKNPWIDTLITRLSNDSQLLTMFFINMKKAQMTYGITRSDESAQTSGSYDYEGFVSMDIINRANKKESAGKEAIARLQSHNPVTDRSVFNSDGKINKTNINTRFLEITELSNRIGDINDEEVTVNDSKRIENILSSNPDTVKTVTGALQAAGFVLSEKEVKTCILSPYALDNGVYKNNLAYLLHSLDSLYSALKDNTHINSADDIVSELPSEINALSAALVQPDTTTVEKSVRQNGKTRYTYVLPSDLDNIIEGLKGEQFSGIRGSKVIERVNKTQLEYIREKYLQDYYYFSPETGYRSLWLEDMMGENGTIKTIDYVNILDHTDDKGKTTEPDSWDRTLRASMHYSMYRRINTYNNTAERWYPIPVPSDVQTARYIKFTSYEHDDLVRGYTLLIEQEIERILRTDSLRNMPEVYVANKNKFCMLPILNDYNGRSARETADYLSSLAQTDKAAYKQELKDMAEYVLNHEKETYVKENWQFINTELLPGKYSQEELIALLSGNQENDAVALREYIENSAYAQSQMIELFIGDPAYFKSYTDLQKRFKQIIVPKTPVDPFNKDANPNQEEELHEKAMYIADITAASNSIEDIKKLHAQKLAEGKISQEEYDAVVNSFSNITYTDGQAFRTPKGLKKLLYMQGVMRKNDALDQALDSIFESVGKNKPINKAALDVISKVGQSFVIKPFPSGLLTVDAGNGITKLMPIQHKCSEQLLTAALSCAAMTTGQSPVLNAMAKFADKNDVDVFIFNSGVKEGNNGYFEIENAETSGYTSTLNITQNASGRLGNTDAIDELQYKLAQEQLLRGENVEEATRILVNLRERKQQQMQLMFNNALANINAKATVEQASGSWEGDREYSFVIKLEADTETDYADAIEAATYIAESLKQWAFLENHEINKSEIPNDADYLKGDISRSITLTLPDSYFENENREKVIAELQELISTFEKDSRKQTEQKDIFDYTISGNSITFVFPASRYAEQGRFGDITNVEQALEKYEKEYESWAETINKQLYEYFTSRKIDCDRREATQKVSVHTPDKGSGENGKEWSYQSDRNSRLQRLSARDIQRIKEETVKIATGEAVARRKKNTEKVAYDVGKEERILRDLNSAAARRFNSPIHSIPYSMYGTVSSVPEHGVDKTINIGTQLQKIIAEDIPENATFSFEGRNDVSKKEILAAYNALYTEKIMRAYKDITGTFADKYVLSMRLQEAVKNSSRGSEVLQRAFMLDENDNFIIPLGDLSTITLSSEFLNSIIRKAVTKVEVPGGQLVQMSVFGLKDKLSLEFYRDKEGNPTALKAVQCYLSAYSKTLMEAYMDDNGYINPDHLPEDLKKAIGCRIPTAGKNFIVPLKVVGFLPGIMPTTIVLPADIVALSDSDFDVDKVPTILPSINRYNIKKARHDYNNLPEVKQARKEENEEYRNGLASGSLKTTTPPSFYKWYNENKEKYKAGDGTVEYAGGKIKNLSKLSTDALNNKLLECMYAMATSPAVAEQIVNSGDTGPALRAAEKVKGALELSSEVLSPASISTLITQQDRNNVGKNMISVFAVANAFHAIIEHLADNDAKTDFAIKEEYRFTINGYSNLSMTKTRDRKGNLISKNIGACLNAAADNAKNPLLYYLNFGKNTANAASLLLHLGYTIEDAGMFLNIPAIQDYLKNGGDPDYVNGYSQDERVLPGDLSKMVEAIKYGNPLTSNDKEKQTEFMQYNATALGIFKLLQKGIGQDMFNLGMLTRNDSGSSAPHGPLENNIARILKYKQYMEQNPDEYYFDGWQRLFSTSPNYVEAVRNSSIPIAQALTSYGTFGAYEQLSKLYPGLDADDFLDTMLTMLNRFYGGYITPQNVKSILYDMYAYMHSTLRSFRKGSRTTEETRHWYLSDKDGEDNFINNAKALLNKYPALNDLSFIRHLVFGNKAEDSPFVDLSFEGQLVKDVRDQLSRDWTQLFYSDNPEIRAFAQDLYVYSFFRNGLQFTNGSFAHLAPTEARTELPGYTTELQRIMDDGGNVAAIDGNNFITQYLRNHLRDKTVCWSLKRGYYPYIGKNREILDRFKVAEGTEEGDYLRKRAEGKGCFKGYYNGQEVFYIAVKQADGTYEWVRTTPLGWGWKASEYNNSVEAFYLESVYDQDRVKNSLSKKTNNSAIPVSNDAPSELSSMSMDELEELEALNTDDTMDATSAPSSSPATTTHTSNSKKEPVQIAVLTNRGYQKGEPQRHPDIDYIFTENAEAFAASHKSKWSDTKFGPYNGAIKTNVSDVGGKNQAGIRTDVQGNVTKNAYGIIVKKYQHAADGSFVRGEGQWKDTVDDFATFIEMNDYQMSRIQSSPNKKKLFPASFATGKSALPKSFASWLKNELFTRFHLVYDIVENTMPGYSGYGLIFKENKNVQSTSESPLKSNTDWKDATGQKPC